MRGCMIMCAVALACLFWANTANAAEIPRQTLATMGLSDMATMTDVQGLEVRGQGWVRIWGNTSFSSPYHLTSHGPFAFRIESTSGNGALAGSFGFAL